ncbi:GtrA family protein [Legionella sp.]|uniref:GtrA family protein n=1 Tax=Legionella sp. TaxID=459 RepID=UPI0039E4CB28
MQYFSKFLIVGALNTILGYAVIFSCMYSIKASPEISNLLGYSVGLITSYFLNRHYTFKSNLAKNKEFLRFICVFCIAYFTNFVVLELFIYHYNLNYAFSQIFAGFFYISTSFLMNKYYVFK